MDAGQFIFKLIDERSGNPLPLKRPVETTEATILDEGWCFHPAISTAMPLQELCQALVEKGFPDVAMRLTWPDHRAAGFVLSIHECAAFRETPLDVVPPEPVERPGLFS